MPNVYESETADSMLSLLTDLKSKGVNRVYVDVWNNGKVYFQSPTMSITVQSGGGIGDDHLFWALEAANTIKDIEVWAWFEYGLMTSYGAINNDFAIVAEYNGWILGEASNFYWMDCANMEVLAFLSGIMNDAMEAISSGGKSYFDLGLMGVQLDDHFASPISLGRTSTQMDSAMSFIRTNYRYNLSLSPSTLSFSIENYNVDWNKWGEQNQYDEVVPQIYRTTFSAFQTEFSSYPTLLSNSTIEKWVASGIRVDGSGEPTPWADVSAMIQMCELYGQGASVWYAHGILEIYPNQFVALWA